MAFKLKNFGAEIANAKSILGGVCYYRYFNEDGDNLETPGLFPSNLGLKVGDRITVIPADIKQEDIKFFVDQVDEGVVLREFN